MRKTKRIAALLLCMALLALTPISALAASGGFVPVVATSYTKNGSEWVKNGETKYSYKKDGRLTKISTTYSNGDSYITQYKWKGNLIAKVTYSDGGSYSYKFKKNKLQKTTASFSGGSTVTSFKWKKNTATYQDSNGTGTVKVNGKGQIIKETYKSNDGNTSSSTTKYYSNGNVKSYSYSGAYSSYKVTYNNKGFIISESGISDGKPWSYSIKYITKKGKIVERLDTFKSVDGESYESKIVYSKHMKVSRFRNCDQMGHMF